LLFRWVATTPQVCGEVYWVPTPGKWRAAVGHNGKLFHAGYFDTITEAAGRARGARATTPG
jgi:hypothetical protein